MLASSSSKKGVQFPVKLPKPFPQSTDEEKLEREIRENWNINYKDFKNEVKDYLKKRDKDIDGE